MKVTCAFRIEPETLAQFEQVCESMETSRSHVLRRFVRDYTAKHGELEAVPPALTITKTEDVAHD